MSVPESIECPKMRVIASSNVYLVILVSGSSLFLICLLLAATPEFVAGLTFAKNIISCKRKGKEHALEGSRKQNSQAKTERGKLFPMRRFSH